MDTQIVEMMIANFPNLVGLAILSYVLYRSDQNSERRYDEQVKFLQCLLTDCLQGGQGAEGFSEGKLKTLDDLMN